LKNNIKSIVIFISIWLITSPFSAIVQEKPKTNVQPSPASPITEIKPALQREAWDAIGKVQFLKHKGVPAMKIESTSDTGQIVLRDVIFDNGTIEYDIEAFGSSSIYFRRNGYQEQEIFYLRERFNQTLYNDGIQYCPVIDGVIMWDVFDHFQAPALIKPKEWNHVKLVISGFQMRVYVNDMNKPALEVPHLEGSQKKGTIAFDGNCIVANVVIKPNQIEGLATYEGTDLTNHDANYLRKWLVSSPLALPNGTESHFKKLPDSVIFNQKIEAERHGLLNLTRQFGNNKERKMVWLKTKFNSEIAQQKLLQLGFSDEVWVFVNQKFSYTDKNLYRMTNVRKYPDGRLSTQNATISILLQKGENELLIGIANDFYAWGLVARLMDLEGLSF
jgi:hypothetical protein